MNATITNQAQRAARTLLVVLVLAVGMSLLQSAPASAYTVNNNGRPGRVVGYQVQGTHYNSCTHTTYYTCFTPWVVGTGPLVYRSPASTGAQKIGAVYQLQYYNGSSWIDYGQRIYTRYLRRGDSRLRLPRIDFLPNRGGSFRVKIGVVWTNRRETRNLGAKVLTYNQYGDFVCNTRYPCEAGAGYVWLRSPGV